MKQRILDLIGTPNSIIAEDLAILREEIAVQPYAQSLRALYLLGTKKYDAENFQKVLSTTAAFTTDKKILYQFINGKIYEPRFPEIIVENVSSAVEAPENIAKDDEALVNEAISENAAKEEKVEREGNWISELPKKDLPKKVVIDGQVNRILFPGEENFLNEENTIQIDKEASQESGVLVVEKAEGLELKEIEPLKSVEKSPEKFREDLLALNSELNGKNLNVGSQYQQEETVKNSSDIALNRSVERVREENTNLIAKEKVVESSFMNERPTENKYETERKRLAEEVELRMSKTKKTTSIFDDSEISEENDATVDFFQTQEFSIEKNDVQNKEIEQNVEKKKELKIEKTTEEFVENRFENYLPENSDWKPMHSSDSTVSRSRFSKNEDVQLNDPQQVGEKAIEKPIRFGESAKETEEQSLSIPVFAPTISVTENEQAGIILEKKVEYDNLESNVPNFINTWQNWLKLDRFEPKETETISGTKEKNKLDAIDKFIDTAPKISKFKEEGTFTVKEKKDDIAHLTTETLAKLFLTQKLYSKAINAYKILKEKYPEKTAEFDERIAEIKAQRQK